jgi:hypothetical protein
VFISHYYIKIVTSIKVLDLPLPAVLLQISTNVFQIHATTFQLLNVLIQMVVLNVFVSTKKLLKIQVASETPVKKPVAARAKRAIISMAKQNA